MIKARTVRLRVGRETLRVLGGTDLVGVRAGLRATPDAATSEAGVGYPCPGEYSFLCSP